MATRAIASHTDTTRSQKITRDRVLAHVIQGTVLIAAAAVVAMNLVADVVYGILAPRINVA